MPISGRRIERYTRNIEEKNKIVDQVKKTTLKASNVDQALKEIAVCVSFMSFKGTLNLFFSDLMALLYI